MNFLNISNADRLTRYPSGKCPLCGETSYDSYLDVDEDEIERGVVCTHCGEKYRTEEPIAWIDNEPVYRQ